MSSLSVRAFTLAGAVIVSGFVALTLSPMSGDDTGYWEATVSVRVDAARPQRDGGRVRGEARRRTQEDS